MKRKAIQLNPTTLAITLPKAWTVANAIKKGDELEVSTDSRNLLISKGGGLSGERVRIDFTELGIFEKNYISSLYQAGVDEIEVVYDDPSIVLIIQEHVDRYCIGFDIVERSNACLLIRSISQGIDLDFDQLYMKNMLLMEQMMGEIDDSVQSGDYDGIALTRSLEQHENKVQCLLLRYISKNGFPPHPRRERAAYELIREIENICDVLKRVCDYLSGSPIIQNREKRFCSSVKEHLFSFRSVYYGSDVENAKLFFEGGKKLVGQGYGILENTLVPVFIHHLIDVVNRVYFLSHPYFEIAAQ